MSIKVNQKNRSFNLPMLLVVSTAFVAAVTNIQGFKALLPFVEDELAISRTQAGLYSTFYFFSAAIVAIFSGRITDTLGSKRGLLLGLTVLGVLMILHSVAPTFSVLLILGLLSGFAFSLITPSGNKGVISLSSGDKRAFAMGITQAGGGVGGVLGALALPFIAEFIGWRNAVLFAGVFALLVAVFILKKYQLPEQKNDNGKAKTSFSKDLKYLIAHPSLLHVCIIGLVFGITISTVTTHLTLYLTGDIGTSSTMAGAGLALFQLGGVFGHPSWGYFNDRVLNKNRPAGLMLLGVLISLVAAFMGFYGQSLPISVIIFVPFVLGFVTMGIPALYFTTVGEIVEEELVGTATGLALIFIRTANFVSPPIFGWIADMRDNYDLSWIVLSLVVLTLSLVFYSLTRNIKLQQS